MAPRTAEGLDNLQYNLDRETEFELTRALPYSPQQKSTQNFFQRSYCPSGTMVESTRLNNCIILQLRLSVRPWALAASSHTSPMRIVNFMERKIASQAYAVFYQQFPTKKSFNYKWENKLRDRVRTYDPLLENL